MAPCLAPCTALLDQSDLERAVCRALRCDPAALQQLDGDERRGSLGDGFLSECGSVAVQAVVRGQPHSLQLFVKRSDSQDAVVGMDCFPREAVYYERILPVLAEAWSRTVKKQTEDAARALPDLGPAAFLSTDNLLVLEDLTRCGYGALPAGWMFDSLGIGALRQVLRALARLHAASLVAERRCGARLVELAPHLVDDTFMTRRPGCMGRRIFDTGADTVADYILPEIFSSLAVPQTDAELRRLQDETRDLYAQLDADLMRSREEVLVVNHGDAWPNNVLVKLDSKGEVEHAAMVDYQMLHICPPALDVTHFLLVSTRRDFRERHMDGLLADYYGYLADYCLQRGLDLTKEFTMADFLASVQRVLPQARCLSAAYKPIVAGRAEDIALLFTDKEERAQMLYVSKNRGALVSRWLTKGEPKYRELVQEAVEELLQLPASAPKEQGKKCDRNGRK